MNTPYFRGSNEENAMATSPLGPPNTINATPNRRVLGEVSTNQRVFSSPATGGLFSQKKAMMGSPLKRSFTAAVEEGYGLKYLKRRRVSGDMGFGLVEQRVQTPGRNESAGMLRAQSVPEVAVTHAEPPSGFPPSPTEPNTPSDSGGETHESFSSLINYDPTSQHAATTRPRSRQQKQQQKIREEPPPPEFTFKSISHAETLRLRLQVAMYKIKTNQIHVPFAELQIERDEHAEASSRRRVNEAVEEAVATLRREAMERMPQKQGPTPTLIPGPLLHPTAFSSRMIPHPEHQKAANRLPPVALFGRHGSAPLPSSMAGSLGDFGQQ
ncbi:hypothetical protein Q7P37_004019 [Cladosporium fusiforme]